MQATALDQNAPRDAKRSIIRRSDADGKPELIEARWGLKPKEPGDRPRRFIRSEDKLFPSHRCLIPASEFHVTHGKRRYRFQLEDGNFFYLAGLWRPATSWWPEACAVLTVQANAEVSRYQDRQGAIIRLNRHMHWLDFTLPEDEQLQPLPPRSFIVDEITDAAATQTLLPI